MAENLSYTQALRAAGAALGRALTPAEEAEIKTLTDAGITQDEWLNLLPSINTSGSGKLFPDQPTAEPSPGAVPQAVTSGESPQAPTDPGAFVVPGQTESDIGGVAKFGPTTAVDDFTFLVRPPETPVGVVPTVSGAASGITPNQKGRNEIIAALAATADANAQAAVTRSFATFSQRFTKRTPDSIAQWQRRLIAAGLMTEEELQRDRSGNAGVYTLGALAELAWEAHFRDTDLQTQLDVRLDAAPESDKAMLRAAAEAQHHQLVISLYEETWGRPPPASWLEANKDRNRYELEYEMRQSPAFKLTPKYQEERISADADLARQFGSDGVGIA